MSVEYNEIEETMSVDDPSEITETVAVPRQGWGVLHLFAKAPRSGADKEGTIALCKRLESSGYQVITFAVLGHKADIGFMVIGPDLWKLREFQGELSSLGYDFSYSYFSITEVSEYASSLSEARKKPRLYPKLPPEGKMAICFYPMSKARGERNNWYALSYDERERLMFEHGTSGRKFSERVTQLVTGSTGLDDYEWGVTLFAERPDDLKEVVYTMRYDEASTLYGIFGPFYTGLIAPPAEVLDLI
ncbi:chlorite dismutase [Ferrithrix thermotolerans DSM 19514]|uniref:Coproheme decarboxylase n=1 Tax=Ferrithrix thermotolerans DSM 19514 TaxID=1121881 RepID=A0A1M4XQQ5_9ACTN|nr:chlorite dismutase family protein [Ferrithrix thermotolerans]SHE95750.1 chlorite dismutase [Ferrithrix thermotolerans DSM 19514]